MSDRIARLNAALEGHDVEQKAVGLARIEERKDVRVLEVRRGLDFGHEALGADHCGQLGFQNKESN